MPLPADILVYCRIHARKCEDEGLHMRAIVLDEAAAEIERLRKLADVAALREIVSIDCDPVCCNQPKVVQTGPEEYSQECCGCPIRNWEGGFLKAHGIARAALSRAELPEKSAPPTS